MWETGICTRNRHWRTEQIFFYHNLFGTTSVERIRWVGKHRWDQNKTSQKWKQDKNKPLYNARDFRFHQHVLALMPGCFALSTPMFSCNHNIIKHGRDWQQRQVGSVFSIENWNYYIQGMLLWYGTGGWICSPSKQPSHALNQMRKLKMNTAPAVDQPAVLSIGL